MDIIFLVRDGRQRCHVSGLVVRGLVAAAVLVAAGLFFAGMKYGIASVRVPPTGAVSLWHEDLAAQEAAVADAIEVAQDDLNALSARLADLQADAVRLNALGERLVAVAKLDPSEFAFERAVPVGGRAPGVGELHADSKVVDFLADLRQLERDLRDRKPKLEVLESVLTNRELRAETVPRGRPVKNGWRSSGYGYRRDPVSGRRAFHHGMDYAGRPGSEVIAVASGVVGEAGYKPGYGNIIRIVHADGYVTRYAHNQKNLVATGDTVHKGQVIALMGSTGRTTGTHVHFEVAHQGKSINPREFVQSPGE